MITELRRWEQENRGSKASGFLVSLGKSKNMSQSTAPTEFSPFMISSERSQLAAQATRKAGLCPSGWEHQLGFEAATGFPRAPEFAGMARA